MVCRYCGDTKKLTLFSTIVECTECPVPVHVDKFANWRNLILAQSGWDYNEIARLNNITILGIQEYFSNGKGFHIGIHAPGSEFEKTMIEKAGGLPAWSFRWDDGVNTPKRFFGTDEEWLAKLIISQP